MILQGRLLVDPYQIPLPGWIRLGEQRISQIGAGDPPETPAAGDEDSLISPGFIDAHIHLPQIDSMDCDAPTESPRGGHERSTLVCVNAG